MEKFNLTERQKKLLKIIVEQYINEATPISSKEVIEKFFKNLSSATIRNEMAYLEKVGLIEKTHTSSGRIPSENGYRYYKLSQLADIHKITALKSAGFTLDEILMINSGANEENVRWHI